MVKILKMAKAAGKSEAFIALQKIKEAEEKARKIIEDARENKASQIVQDAYEEGRKIKEDLLAKTREEAEKKKKVIIKKAATEAEKIRKKAEAEAEEMSQRIESLMPEAVAKIRVEIRRFLEGGSL